MSMTLPWSPYIRTSTLSRPLPRNVLTLSSLIAVLFALALTATATVEVMDDLTKLALPISRDLSLPATDHLLLQVTVKDIKAAETLDVVVEDSHPVVDVEAAVDDSAQHAPLVYTLLKMKHLLRIKQNPNLPI